MGKVLTVFAFVLISESLGEIKEIPQGLQNSIHKVNLKRNFSKTKMITNLVPSEINQTGNKT